MPDPSPPNPKPPGGIHIGDIAGGKNVDLDMNEVAGGDLSKITNSPGASIGATTIIHEAPRKLSREEQLAQRNRQTMLAKVKAYWVDGVLANSLHSKVIPLDMERNPGAVTRPRPWDMLWQVKDQQPQPLPPGTRIIDRFQYMAGEALLILGEPGSGKTTMLLELAGDLLSQATQDESLRIPVVFNLSSWASKQLPLTDWLMAELQTLYLIPKKTAQTWVDQDDILPLLDGLDEVAQEHRPVCIQAINDYRAKQGTPLVVCSRTADYETIGRKLFLSDALILRPLTPDQITDYLLAGGPALEGVRLALQQDDTLQEMAQSPLMLSIMAVAYRDQAPEQFTSTNLDERGRQLFATYIQRQLPQRQKDPREDPATTLRQLTYLAHQMTTRDQTIFLIERLQPTWLPTPQQQRRYLWSVVRVTHLSDIRPMEKLNWSWRRFFRLKTVLGLVLGLIVWLAFWLIFERRGWLGVGLGPRPVGGLVGGVALGLILGLASGLSRKQVELKIRPNEGMKNSAQNAIRFGLGFGLFSGLSVGLALGGEAVIKHYVLRFWLHRYGYLPLRLVPFLDLAAERLILQKVGGGYRFVHRLLQEYLASLHPS